MLEALIVKSMQAKGYSREQATQRAEVWLAGELGVGDLSNLDISERWHAEAIIDRALLPPPKLKAMKMVIPAQVQRFIDIKPLGEEYWQHLRSHWGDEFFDVFFGEAGDSKAMLSPGQKAQREYSNMELMLA